MGTVTAWIRLKSDSLWSPALFHAAHNLIIQGIFDTTTRPGPYSGYLTGEFGIGLAVTVALAGLVLIRLGGVPRGPAITA